MKAIALALLVAFTLAGCGTSPLAARSVATSSLAARATTGTVPATVVAQARTIVAREMQNKTFDDASHKVIGTPSVTATSSANVFAVKGTLSQDMLWGGVSDTPFTCTVDVNAGTIANVKLAS